MLRAHSSVQCYYLHVYFHLSHQTQNVLSYVLEMSQKTDNIQCYHFYNFKVNFLATRALFQSLSCSYILSYAFMYLCLISRSMFVSFVVFNCNLPTLSLPSWETRNEVLPMCFFSIPNLLQKYINTGEIICQLDYLKEENVKIVAKEIKYINMLHAEGTQLNGFSIRCRCLLFWYLTIM